MPELSQREVLRIATGFRKGILGKNESAQWCFAVCAPLESLLNLAGCRCVLTEGEVGEREHYWLTFPDGKILDPTADQFKQPDGSLMPPIFYGQKPCWYRGGRVPRCYLERNKLSNLSPKTTEYKIKITEKEFSQQVVDLAHLLGWEVFRTWNSQHSPAGEPDLRLVRPPRFIHMELKSEKGKLSQAQEQVIAMLRQCPQLEVYVLRPSEWDRIQAVLE